MKDNDKIDAIKQVRKCNSDNTSDEVENGEIYDKQNNEEMNIFEKIQYHLFNIFYGQNKTFNILFVVILLILVFWFKFAKNDFADTGYIYGYINNKGETAIKPQFDNAGDFHEGLAFACKHEKCGYIDKTGRFVIKPRFFATRDFYEGLASVTTIKPFSGYIDKTGRFVIKPKLFWAGDFHEGLAQVSFWDGPLFKDDYTNGIKDDYDSGKNPVKNVANAANIKDGYIDRTGKIVMIFPPTSTSDFYNGLAFIRINDRYGFIDKKGNMVISPKFNNTYSSQKEFPILVELDDNWVYIDRTGKIAIDKQLNKAYFFQEGLAPVKINNKWCYIDKTGKIVINADFDNIGPFSEGLAPFILEKRQGYINKNGKVVINPIFSLHEIPNYPGFKEGLAAVNINNKVGFINKSGQLVIEPDFDVVTQFSEGLIKVGIKKE